ncbi:MAG: hypothetical protein ABIL11_00355 [Chloroflexota bacterium]
MKKKILFAIAIVSLMLSMVPINMAPVQAQGGPVTYDGVEFPLGDKSFADSVVDFNPGSGTGESNGSAAIGPPDGDTGPSVIGAKGDVTLGRGGSITLKFSDNYLIDVEGLDLYVFEYGPDVEPFKVEISKDGSVWIDLGTVSGQPTGLDIHGKVDPDDRFSYVRITDANPYAPRDPTIIGTEAYEGADIDAVGAIGAEERPDSDGDGVADDEDWCSDTPLGMEVDEYGCPVEVLDSDGDGVPDDVDQCLGTPAGVAVDDKGCPEITPTPEQGDSIVLKASLEGKGESTQTLPNSDNYGVIIIEGVVTDQEGKGVSGADVEVVSGADSASITTNADGSYSIAVSVPGGLGNGLYRGVNFTLQLDDLSIHEVVLLQAIEGGQMVQGRNVGVRVYLVWTGASPVEVEVVATVDGKTQPPVRGLVKLAYTPQDNNLGRNSINLVLPHALFPFDSVSTHSIYVTVRLVDESTQETNLENNTSVPESFTLQRTKSPSLLYVSMDPSIGRAELVRFSGQANSFLEKVYPIPFAWSIVGTARVSHYVVSPNTKFLQSQSVESLPNWVPDWVKDGVDYPLQALKSGTYISSIRSVEKARIRYNAQRCTDANGKFILPCNEPIAMHAVGVFPNNAYGPEKAGFAYTLFRNSWRVMLNDIGIPKNVSHELGHLYGLDDEYGGGSTGRPVYGSSWDGSLFRTETGGSINFMGQVHLGSPWVDSQTWNTLLGILKVTDVSGTQKTAALNAWMPRLDDRLVTEIEGPALIVEGVVGQDGRATLESMTPIHRYETPAANQGTFTLRALDEQQNVLAETQFDGLFSDQYDDISPIVPFLVVLPVPDPDQVTLITISQAGGTILASLERSPSIPTANFDPIPAISDAPVTISWQANDADGDVLLSTLFYSANGGLTWQVLGTDLPVNSLTVDSQELPGGESRFLLIVNDGMNEVEVVSAPIMVPNRPPVVVILDTYGTTFESGEPVALQGFSDDVEDGSLPDGNFYWSDELGQIVWQGYNMQAELPVGQHKITLEVTDTDGQVGSASIDITVQAGTADNGKGNETGLPVFNLPAIILFLLGGGACVLLLMGSLLVGGVFLLTRGRKQTRMPGAVGQAGTVQDQQGNWWYQDPGTGRWNFWNGQAWQPVPGTVPNVAAPQ